MTDSRINLPANKILDPTMALLTNSNYEFFGRLGEGGFGEVYEAWDKKLCRRVAIKRLKNVLDSPPESLIKEARLVASLQHAAFVNIHAIEEDENSQSIVMELVPGVTLKEWIQTQPLDDTKALELVRQIAEAMQEAHGSGLIHGDLKPSNLIVEPSGKARILDFGLAVKSDSQATTSLLEADPQGTILYELLTGARPFASVSGLALAAAHMQSSSDSWTYPAAMAQPLVKLIRGMTARQPEQRLASMQEVCSHIAALKTVNLNSPVNTLRFVGWSMRIKKLRWVMSAVLATILLITVAWRLVPYTGSLPSSLVPFSAALEFDKAWAALKLFDRPGSLDAAEKSFMEILESNPNSAAAVAGLSLVYSFRYENNRDDIWLQKADAGAQQALSVNDQLALSYVASGMVKVKQAKYDIALQALDHALRLEPDNTFALYAKLRALRDLNKFDDAEKLSFHAIKRFPQAREFADALGEVYYKQGKYVEAEAAFRRSIKLQPDAVFGYANLSAVLLYLNRSDEALHVLQKGLQIRPSFNLYTNLGNVLFARGDYLSAASAFENAISPGKGNAKNYLGWANLADTLLWIPGRSFEAKNAYQKSIDLLSSLLVRAPKNATLVSRMGLYLARVERKPNAIKYTEQARILAPNDSNVHFRAGLAYELIGNRKLALEAIAKAKLGGYPVNLIDSELGLTALRSDVSYY